MHLITRLFGKCSRHSSRRRSLAVCAMGLGLEPLEGRALMALVSSVGFDPTGQEVAESIYNVPEEFTGSLGTFYTPG